MPKIAAEPRVGRSRSSSIRIIVVLPAPFRPRKPKISPRRTTSETPRTAWTDPYDFARSRSSIAGLSDSGAISRIDLVTFPRLARTVGDVDFHDLYSRYARDVHRFALYLSGNPALADDITSETFLRAWSS